MAKPSKIARDPNYSKGVNLSGFDPVSIAASFDDIDVRNGSQKIHFSRTGATTLNKTGDVKSILPSTPAAQQAANAKAGFLANLPAPLKSALPIIVIGGGILIVVLLVKR